MSIPDDVLAKIMGHLGGGGPIDHALFGPVVTRPETGAEENPPFYFILVSGRDRGEVKDARANIDCLGGETRTLAEELRDVVLAALISERRSAIVLQMFDDELQQAVMAATLWPGERTERIVAAMKAERT